MVLSVPTRRSAAPADTAAEPMAPPTASRGRHGASCQSIKPYRRDQSIENPGILVSMVLFSTYPGRSVQLATHVGPVHTRQRAEDDGTQPWF